MWWKVIAMAIIVPVFVMTGVILYGVKRWQSRTKELQAQIEAAHLPITPKSYDPRELKNLPLPVQHYFRTVLKEGQPLVAAASMSLPASTTAFSFASFNLSTGI